MIVQLTGTLVEVTPSRVILDVNGFGMELGVSATTAATLPAAGTPGVTVLTRFVVREDAMTLYGFASDDERSLFDRLCAISGVGPKVALSILSSYTPAQLASIVVAQDASQMTAVPGVGKKLAGRLLLELEGILAKDPTLGALASGAGRQARAAACPRASATGVEQDVTAALLQMGFTSAEASLALEGREDAGALDVKSALKYALSRLGGGR